MASILPNFEYDIFVSYRHNDNRSGWVSDFVEALKEELAAAIKEPLSVYFDKNTHDGLLETHNVDKSLEGKLKCLVFIPILSQTYCDPKGFAWQHEFCAFNKLSREDKFGQNVKVSNGNVASRILPVRIHDLDAKDKATIEQEISGPLRSIEFIFKSPGVNRPLRNTEEHPHDNQNKTYYRDQINKTANAIKDILAALSGETLIPGDFTERKLKIRNGVTTRKRIIFRLITAIFILALMSIGYYLFSSASTASGRGIDDPSVAVVPFDNLSNEPNQDYISDGVMEAILNHLAKIEGLRLTSRTTMMTYKKTDKTIKQIADEVGVRYVLEGSVQKVGNTIRINAQLIDGATDEHVWSEYYDRKVSDLLLIESEVAQQIAIKLSVEIQPDAKSNIEALPTRSQEAYDLYLKASQYQYLKSSQYQGFQTVSQDVPALLTKAIQIDSAFADAYALLAWHHTLRGLFLYSAQEAIQRAEPLFNTALRLDPNCVRAHSGLGLLSLWFKWDYYAAEREFNNAVRLEPSNIPGLNSDMMISIGNFKKALEFGKLKVKAEPNNIHLKIDLAFTLFFSGNETEALQWADSAKSTAEPLNPSFSDLGRIYVYTGRYREAIEVNKKYRAIVNEENGWSRVDAMDAISYLKLGQRDVAMEILKRMVEHSERNIVTGSPSFYAAMVYAQMGEADVAFKFLDIARSRREVEMYWIGVEPPFKPLHSDPRWQKLLDEIDYPKKY